MITILHIFSKAELFCINKPKLNTGTHFCESGSTLVLVSWIRIQEDNLTHKKEEIACFEVLYVFFLGLMASRIAGTFFLKA